MSTSVPRAVRVEDSRDLGAALSVLGVRCGRPVLVSVGGAAGMAEDHVGTVAALVREWLVPVIERLGAAVIDGGTNVGVMRVLGEARVALDARFPLIGVAAAGTITAPVGDGSNPDAAEADPNHTHLVLVPGVSWGDESSWLPVVAAAVAEGSRSVTLVINGGDITYDDVARSIEAGRPVIVVAGAGRTADALAGAVAGEAVDDRAVRLADSPLLQVVPLAHVEHVVAAVETALGGTHPRDPG